MSVGRNTGRVSRQTLSGRLRSGGRSGAAYGRTAGQQDEGEQRPIDDAVRSMDSAAARFKQMSAVTAAAVAVAVVAVGYGLWQAGASRAAVDQATKGARSVVVTTRDVAAGDPLGADAVQLVEVPRPSAKTMRLAPTPLTARAAWPAPGRWCPSRRTRSYRLR